MCGEEGFCDANWISNHNEGKSTSGYVFTLGGAAVSWKSSKQTVNNSLTMEAEFVALDKAAEEAEWLRSFLEDTAYLCLHFTKDHEGNRINTSYPENPIRRIQVIECEDSGRYGTWSKLQETPNTPYQRLLIRRNGYLQKDKNKAKTEQNRARDWKEHGKLKPKAYAS
ncbi:ATP phosphoribosyltransferase 1, chloroplastic [Tanacetum coccineum]